MKKDWNPTTLLFSHVLWKKHQAMHRAIQGKGLLQGAGICCRCLGTLCKLQMWKLHTYWFFKTAYNKKPTLAHIGLNTSMLRCSLCSCKCAGLAFGFKRAFTSCSINASRCVDAEQITTSRDTERPWSSLGFRISFSYFYFCMTNQVSTTLMSYSWAVYWIHQKLISCSSQSIKYMSKAIIQ